MFTKQEVVLNFRLDFILGLHGRGREPPSRGRRFLRLLLEAEGRDPQQFGREGKVGRRHLERHRRVHLQHRARGHVRLSQGETAFTTHLKI